MKNPTNNNECVIVFSGGTDSMCVAALMAERYQKIHLLTYFDYGTKDEPIPLENAQKLKSKFPNVDWVFKSFPTDKLIRHFSYHNYLKSLLKYRLFNMITPAFSSLSWHVRTIAYCLENDIQHSYDGMTNEMLQLPGHMSSVLEVLRNLYHDFNINYENPVRDWEVPHNQDVLDRIIVDQHGFLFPSEETETKKTTGEYLFKLGIFHHPNIKGSVYDRQMQHDCYQFVLYNILTYWLYLNFMSYEKYSQKVSEFISTKVKSVLPQLEFLKEKNKEKQTSSLFEYGEEHELV